MSVEDRIRRRGPRRACRLVRQGVAAGFATLVAATGLRAQAPPVELSLAQAVSVASDTAPAVSLARLRTREAEARLTQSRAVFFPRVGGAGAFVRERRNSAAFGIDFPTAPGQPGLPARIGPFNLWDARAEASQTLFSPAGWLQASEAERGVDVSTAETGTAAQSAAARAAASYVAALEAEATLNARLREQELARELLDVAEQQLQAGVGTRLDLVRARTQVAAAGTAIELARSQRTEARIELARSLGYPAGTELALTDTLGAELGRSAAPRERAEAVDMALRERPELGVAHARLEEATVGARAVSAERLGSLQLVGDYGVNGREPSNLIATGRLALRYSIPVFQGFRLDGRRDEREAQAAETRLELAELREEIVAEVESALTGVESGEARQALAREQLALAEEEVREARLLFGNGLAGNIALITAQTDLVNANNAMIDALAQTAGARVRLARAVGVTRSLQ